MAGANRFGEIAANLPAKAILLVDAYQGFWVDLAKQLAPVDDGDLRNSIAPAPGDGAYQRRVVATAAHAVHQEYGTIFQPGTPFMRASHADLQPSFKADVRMLVK